MRGAGCGEEFEAHPIPACNSYSAHRRFDFEVRRFRRRAEAENAACCCCVSNAHLWHQSAGPKKVDTGGCPFCFPSLHLHETALRPSSDTLSDASVRSYGRHRSSAQSVFGISVVGAYRSSGHRSPAGGQVDSVDSDVLMSDPIYEGFAEPDASAPGNAGGLHTPSPAAAGGNPDSGKADDNPSLAIAAARAVTSSQFLPANR